jgi:hypothetical protein
MEENRIPPERYYIRILGATRMRGRPRNRWQDEAREDGRWGWRRVARKGTQHTRGIGLEVSADKMVMSQDQNAGRIHSVRIGNSTFERVEE